jgi:hypothetical protein
MTDPITRGASGRITAGHRVRRDRILVASLLGPTPLGRRRLYGRADSAMAKSASHP